MGLFEEFENVSYQDWINRINIDLKGKDFQETLVWKSKEGIDVQPIYNNESLANIAIDRSIPIKDSSSWKITETIFIDSISEANAKALTALKGGANSILFIGDIKEQQDMDALLANIQLDLIDLHFYTSTPLQTSKLVVLPSGSISYDYLGELFLSGQWNGQKDEVIKDIAGRTQQNTVTKTITVQANHYANAGANCIQELAFGLSHALEYFNLLTDEGIDAEILAQKIQFTFGIGSNYFFEIAKLRAARSLWKLILTQYNASSKMFIHSTTTFQEQEDKAYNMLRNTTQAMAAVIGGCNSLTVLPHDETVDFSTRIARNVQHILKEEAFFDKVRNPADGAYYIEKLTDEMANKTWALFQNMEEQGGYLACLDNGFIHKQLKLQVHV